MDDRFDRRELLLHLGDMLAASSSLARAGAPQTPVVQLLSQQDLPADLAFLRALDPTMTVSDFGARVASAFSRWPQDLLDTTLDHESLASTVQQALFEGNPRGWDSYVAHVQTKVTWFGTRLPKMKTSVSGEPAGEAGQRAAAAAAAPSATPSAARTGSGTRRGWPWPDPETTR
ncbi:hypothetical protein [Paraburkholderia phenoliruptrix]|uniref:hypothetical protein n=1 Tax=Paraburkholderia phenoliruptrix TaxID=252970 RepID=UPI003D982D46